MDAELKKSDTGISSIDRKILKILLSPDVGKSTKSMSAKLGILLLQSGGDVNV